MINPFVMFYFSNSVIPYTKTAKVKLKPCKVDIHCIMKCINFVSQITLRYLPQQLYLFCLYCNYDLALYSEVTCDYDNEGISSISTLFQMQCEETDCSDVFHEEK